MPDAKAEAPVRVFSAIRRQGQEQPNPASNEVQFALVIARMIETVQNSPEHMRQTVYDLARYKLQEQFTHTETKDIQRMQQALETAIRGVEKFSRQRIGIPPPQVPQLSDNSASRIPATDADPPDRLRHQVVHSAPDYPVWPIIKRTAAMLIIVGGIFVGIQERGRLASLVSSLPDYQKAAWLRTALAAYTGDRRCPIVARETQATASDRLRRLCGRQ